VESQSHKHGSLCAANLREKSLWIWSLHVVGSVSYYFNSLLVDFFTLKIARSNPPRVFTLKQFVLLVFLGDHICVLFTFPLLCMIREKSLWIWRLHVIVLVSYYFNSLLVDFFTLRIVRSNPPQVFTLKRFVSLVFLDDHIYVLFTFPLHDMIFHYLT